MTFEHGKKVRAKNSKKSAPYYATVYLGVESLMPFQGIIQGVGWRHAALAFFKIDMRHNAIFKIGMRFRGSGKKKYFGLLVKGS